MILLKKIKDKKNITTYEFNYLKLITYLIIYFAFIILASIIFSNKNLLLKMVLIYLTAFIAIILISVEINKYSRDLKNKISQGYGMKFGWKNRLCYQITLIKKGSSL
jgi:hypothetical protein